MDSRDNQYIDNLAKFLQSEQLISPIDIARLLPLYIKVYNDQGVVRNVSLAYIKAYDGKAMYKKYGKHFDQLYEMFLRNNVEEKERHDIFKRVAGKLSFVPKTVKGIRSLVRTVISETHEYLKLKKLAESRKALVSRFGAAVKKYLHLAYTLGYNEPSLCVKNLVERHKIDKYIMSGDFPVILLPFMPEVETAIKRAYEHYDMQDAWELLQGRYFNHKGEYATLALEIKSAFNKAIPNFSEYFDRIYTDTYYKKMLETEGRR